MLPGIRGIAEELEQVVNRLAPAELPRVIDAALRISADEYADDSDIAPAIEAYRADPHAAQALAEELARKSHECDKAYISLEEQGELTASQTNFRKMCVLNGLSSLFAASSLSLRIVDRFVYELGHGAGNTDLFAKRMIEELQS